MGLATDMKNLTEELLSSFTNRIKENENLVLEVQKTMDGFRKEHQEMAKDLNSSFAQDNADRAKNEKIRMKDFNALMKSIGDDIKGINIEVKTIKNSTAGLLDDLLQNRVQASAEWSKMHEAMTQIRKSGTVK
ncbi:MAG: hypothetical protein WCQ41_10200 [Bacillota bacterium]